MGPMRPGSRGCSETEDEEEESRKDDGLRVAMQVGMGNYRACAGGRTQTRHGRGLEPQCEWVVPERFPYVSLQGIGVVGATSMRSLTQEEIPLAFVGVVLQ